MSNIFLAATVILLLPATASAVDANAAECKAHLASGLATMPAVRFAEELAGAEGSAGNATPAIRGAAVMLTGLNTRIQDRAAELAALKDQAARVQDVAARLAALRARESTAAHFLDPNAEKAVADLQAALVARVTKVNSQLDAERAALDQSLMFHCTASAAPASASAH